MSCPKSDPHSVAATLQSECQANVESMSRVGDVSLDEISRGTQTSSAASIFPSKRDFKTISSDVFSPLSIKCSLSNKK